jgi:hypothetical protein
MRSEPAIPPTIHPPRRVLVAGAAWFLAYVVARYALEEMRMADLWRLAAAFVPLFAFFWFVWVVQRAVKGADEMQRLIQLEALALAFPTTMVVLMTLGLLEIFHEGRLELPLRDLWAILPPLYAICVAVAYQRYR